MGFSVRVAPGIRVRASSRGVRTSLGPRAARLHVAAGRTTFSTGAGPVSYSTSLGHGRSGPRAGTTSAASTRQLAQAAKAEEAQGILAALDALAGLHREEFTLARRPVAPPPPPVDLPALAAKHRKAALVGVGLFDRKGRASAKVAAEVTARSEAEQMASSDLAAQATYQENLDMFWSLLMGNDMDTVLAELAAAFEDNDAAAAPLGVTGNEASLLVLVPGEGSLPERKPDVTAAGNLALKKVTKTELADWYRALVNGYVLVTVKEALAVAPGLAGARIVAVRKRSLDAYGRQPVEAILAARFSREALQGIRWSEVGASQVVLDAATELTVDLAPRTHALRALDVAQHPAIGAVLDAVDLDDLEH